jgi:quercetin dioxygenase-like cupin family protein
MPIIDFATVEDKEVFPGIFSRQVLNKKIGGSAAITVGELKIKPGATLPLHVHYVEEALTVIEGEGQVTIDDKAFPIKADVTILAQAGDKHTITNTGKGMLRIIFCFPAVEVERILI